MTLDQVRKTVRYFSAKDTRTRTMTVDDFNINLPFVQDGIVSQELKKIEAGGKIIPDLLSSSPLRVFKKMDSIAVDNSDGSFDLPEDYLRYLALKTEPVAVYPGGGTGGEGMPTTFTGGYKDIDVVPEKVFNMAQSDVLSRPDINPKSFIQGTKGFLLPFNISTVNLNYLRKPVIPFYDYCQDSDTLNDVYMPAGSDVHLDDANTSRLYLNGTVIYSNILWTGTTFPYQSKSVELEWEDYIHWQFVYRLLSMVGLNIQMDEIIKYANGIDNAQK